jgi:hypothetical protein
LLNAPATKYVNMAVNNANMHFLNGSPRTARRDFVDRLKVRDDTVKLVPKQHIIDALLDIARCDLPGPIRQYIVEDLLFPDKENRYGLLGCPSPVKMIVKMSLNEGATPAHAELSHDPTDPSIMAQRAYGLLDYPAGVDPASWPTPGRPRPRGLTSTHAPKGAKAMLSSYKPLMVVTYDPAGTTVTIQAGAQLVDRPCHDERHAYNELDRGWDGAQLLAEIYKITNISRAGVYELQIVLEMESSFRLTFDRVDLLGIQLREIICRWQKWSDCRIVSTPQPQAAPPWTYRRPTPTEAAAAASTAGYPVGYPV